MGIKAKPWALKHINFTSFKKLEIEIIAPDLSDRGQVHQLRDSSFDFVSVLSGNKATLKVNKRTYSTFKQQQSLDCVIIGYPLSVRHTLAALPPIELTFRDAGTAVWGRQLFDPQLLQEKAISSGTSFVAMYPLILLTSYCGSGVEVSVCDTEGLTDPQGKLTMEQCLQCAPGKILGWLQWSTRQHQISLEMEGLLDTLDGPTANHLRLLRYQYWPRYVTSIQELLK